jgi:tetratricopeptide (TPR) repeat protein
MYEHLHQEKIATGPIGKTLQFSDLHHSPTSAETNNKGLRETQPNYFENFVLRNVENSAIQMFRAQYAEAERLLERTLRPAEGEFSINWEERNQTLEIKASACIGLGEWNEAENIFLDILKGKSLADKQKFRTMHALAEVHLAKNNLENAESFCQKAIRGWESTLGKQHVLFYLSIHLLVEIYRAKGDLKNADGYRTLLPSSMQGLVPQTQARLLI